MSDLDTATTATMKNIAKQFGCYNPSPLKTYRLDEIGREWCYAHGRFETTQKQQIRILDHQRTGE